MAINLVRGASVEISPERSGGAYPEQVANFLPGMLESSDDLFAAVNSERQLVAFNAAFRGALTEITGTPPQLDQNLEQLLANFPVLANTVIELCQRAFDGEALRLPMELLAQDNQQRYFDASISPITDPDGTVLVVAIAMRDITDRRVTEQRFQGVLEATPDAMLVVYKGIIEFVNSQLERMFGYAKGALLGLPLERLVPERLRERHILQRVGYERNSKTRPMGSGLDLWGLKADGSEFPVEISLSPLEISGEKRVIAAVRDISAHRQTEEDLRDESSDLRTQLAMLQRRQDAPSDLEVYRAGFDKAAAAMVHYGPDCRIKRVNTYFCQLVGYSREELTQLNFSDITHADDVLLNLDLDSKLLAGAIDHYQVDKRLLRKDRTVLWVRLAVSLQRCARGKPEYFIGVAEDISERKRTEEALREAQLRLTLATEIARVGYAELDLENRGTYLSSELKRQLGYEDAELPSTFCEWSRRLHPEDHERVTKDILAAMEGPGGGLDLEYRLCHKDGSYHWFFGRGVALEDFPGHAYRVLLTQIDITARRNSEKLLREQTEELRLALRVGRSGTFQWNVQTREHRWYDEMLALYGLKPEEFGGRDEDWLDCLLEEDRAAAMAAVEVALRTGDYVAEFRIQRRNDEQIRWISARGQVFFDEAGIARRMVGINVDVTEERRVQGELEESKARLQGILNSLQEGVVVFDAEGRVIDANPAALELLHYHAPEQIRRRVEEFAESFEMFDLSDRLLSVDEWPLSRVLRGESFSDEELKVCRKDHGDTLIASYNGTPIRDADGNVTLGVLSLVDISERKRAERALQESERRLALALKASNTSVWEVDIATQKLLPAEDELFAMLGYTCEELGTVGDWVALIHEEDRPLINQMFEEIIQGTRDGYQGTEVRYRKKDGSWCWILCQAMATDPDAHGKVTRLVGTHTDIQARKQAEERAREASLHDPLTALPNRALIFEYGSRLLAAAHRTRGHGAVLFIDLDRFKPINDQYGHEVGDRVLQEVGQRLKDCTRDEDLVGRLGGDEFVIILGHPDGHAHRASAVAQHVVDSLRRPIAIDSIEVSITPSIGISFYPEHADNLEGLIHAADLAMYQVKQSGRANYQIYTPELDRRADEVYLLEVRLREALKYGRLVLHYQPVIDAKSGELISAEALVRFADNDEGEVSGPAAFIPIAESAGLIGDLGEWVAIEACRQHEAWRREGMPVTIAINVSPLQFRQRGFPERLGSIIAQAGIDPAALQVEVTETTVMESDDEASDILNRLKALGVKIALDDFGTGYSSLSRLSRLPLDKLKVDQSFVRGVDTDPASRAITEAIIALGHNLKLDIIGEGIESEAMLHYLEQHGCDQVQGFLFSKPLPASEFAQWHRQHHTPVV
ncbi:PAS domain S-box protein [Dechloromonas sp. XY25]|uniref:PAS domain S-box protein n=1 Tax=Dechloromonas hankyongensis TaxID=2908002 RepID=A0ABS9K282_9RHOO|nr:PAS domain S-box protein [Dechloromonas hankyongensis]MCG2577253.1 PAS domain S-box protein [Dechloromonas hankyongensis]